MSQRLAEKTNGKAWAYAVCGLLLALAAALLFAKNANAEAISYDPYADSVAGTAAVVTDANNALNRPNNTHASLVGAGASLTLDMGQGEEGTQTLAVLGASGPPSECESGFLDSNKALIASETRQLGFDLNPSTQNFAYNWSNYGKVYRFVRISSVLGGGVNVDAIEALGHLGSTASQDTDGDGVSDRQEQTNGTNPLVADTPASANTTNPPRTTRPGGSSIGASAQVNTPPAANNDRDEDGMADDWEMAHGLNPKDKVDAGKDPDHDKLTNLTEYQIGSNPQKFDTDGDGMPDGWEHKHGLDVNKNDADGDPDGDFLTNLGEYRQNTDPNKADDLYKVFARECETGADMSAWDWALFGLLVLGALGAWLAAFKHWRRGRQTESDQRNTR